MTTTDVSRPSFWRRALSFAREVWGVLIRPSSVFSLAFLVLAGFVAGIIFWGAFNTALELTNTETFCISCHEMRSNVFEELKTTVHYNNRSGVRAHCPDCHVPHEWTHKIARKMQASKEVWGKLFGTINTREKFLDSSPGTGDSRMGPHEGQRLPGMPQLPQRAIDGYYPAKSARRRSPSAISVHGSEDLYRLPQRHRPPSARYAQCSRLAVSPTARPRCAKVSVADVTFLALAQQRRFAASGKRNSVFDSHRAAIGLIEHGTACFVAHSENELLSLFSVGTRLEYHADRDTCWRYLLC